MGRSSRQKEKYDSELSGASTYEGTAARTRPLSLEEIMTKRKNREVAADTKDGAEDPDKLSRQDEDKNLSDHPEHDGGHRHSKVSTDVNVKKVVDDTKKRSSRKEEATSLKERNSVNGGDKENRDSETKLKVKLENESGSTKERKNESQRHHSRRNEEHSRDDNGMIKTKERKNENQSHHMSRGDERPRGADEMGRAKERKSESHHRSRSEKRPRDEETRKKPTEKRDGRESLLDAERLKSESERKRKHQNRERDRLEIDRSAVKNHDSDKYKSELVERKDRKKDTSKSHYEGSGQKRRRSRSGEHRARDRSISWSPRAHKRSHDEQEDGESSLHSSKERRQHSDADRNRVASNGGNSSSHNWRQGGRGKRLGGYSPRKRRSEAAIKTPSPTARSPERKNAGWDLPPTGTTSMPASIISDFESINQNLSTEHKISNVPVLPNAVGSLSGTSPSSESKAKDVPSDPIQLTQATRPMRKLYIEDLPASASDKSVIEWFNNLLLSSGANHVQGTQSCISCHISKEKGQALVEFLTVEDAKIALSFDGKFFSSSALRIRRPKDFVDAATGVSERSVPAIDAISDTVKDSPHKIFIGGISNALSSDMLMEIVSTFGHLKAYRFEVNDNLKEPCAFLEYMDQTITTKACAGLNGMKLGGQVLTVVQAVQDASLEENVERPFYGIPEHAKPLLSEPTKVLKLKNVFNPEDLPTLSDSELEETLEDIRLECARFGTVRSINIVRGKGSCGISEQTEGTISLSDERALQDPKGDSFTEVTELSEQQIDHNSGEYSPADASVSVEGLVKDGGNFNDRPSDDKPVEDLGENETTEIGQLDSNMVTGAPTCNLNADTNPQESPSQTNSSKDNSTSGTDNVQTEDTNMRDCTGEEDLKQEANDGLLQEASLPLNHTAGEEPETVEKDEKKEETSEDRVFEHGCVLVEYARAEASCFAAHCLHGRLFGERIVSVDYVSHDLYLSRFPK